MRFAHRLLTTTILAAFLLSGSLAVAEPLKPINLWPSTAPGEKGDIEPEKTLPMKDTIIRVTNVSEPTITIYRPAADKDTKASVVICPGGGYSILAMGHEGTDVAEWLNTLGITGVLLKYRVPARKAQEKYLAPLQDAQRAVSLVRHRASEFGLDGDKIGVLGFSAGGHLAATLSNQYDKRAYEPIDATDKVSCRPGFSILIYPAYLVKGKGPELAPEIAVTSKTPKTFLVHAQNDGVVVQSSLYYYLALTDAKVEAEMHLFPTGGHGYGMMSTNPVGAVWPSRAAEWLRAIGMAAKSQ